MTNYRGLLWSLVAIAGTATAAAVAYRYVTRGVRPSEDEDAESRRRNGAGSGQTETEADRRRAEERDADAYELLSDEEGSGETEYGMEGADAMQIHEQQLMLVAREGNMLLSIVGLIMIVLVGLVGVVVSWSRDATQSPMELPMFQPLMWLAFGVFTAATVEVLGSAGSVTTQPEEIPVLTEKAVFPHDQTDFEMINRYNARKSDDDREDNQPSSRRTPAQPRDSRPHDDEEEKAKVPVVAGDVASIIARAEELFKQNKHQDTRELLKSAITTRPTEIGLLWRLARACNYLVDETSDPEQKKSYAFEGYAYAEKAYEVNANSAASNKWKGIMTGSVGNFCELKDKIAGAYVIRDLIQRAIELDPQDATCHNILGQWCLAFADMTWIEKRAAAALFGKPPTATYEEAVAYFLNAERISPGFWKKNVFLLAQTYYKMKNEDQAREWLVKAERVPVKTKEDEDVAKEIAALMKKLKM